LSLSGKCCQASTERGRQQARQLAQTKTAHRAAAPYSPVQQQRLGRGGAAAQLDPQRGGRNSLINIVLNPTVPGGNPPMASLALRFVLFCVLTFATSAFVAVPYLTIH
jgi:hypothetical protein